MAGKRTLAYDSQHTPAGSSTHSSLLSLLLAPRPSAGLQGGGTVGGGVVVAGLLHRCGREGDPRPALERRRCATQHAISQSSQSCASLRLVGLSAPEVGEVSL
jgi:hypothetical protein